MMLRLGIKSRPHSWEQSALTTAPSLPPYPHGQPNEVQKPGGHRKRMGLASGDSENPVVSRFLVKNSHYN